MRRISLRAILISTSALAAVAGIGAAVYFLPVKVLTAGASEFLSAELVDVGASLGLRLQTLTVEGRGNTSREDIMAALDAERGTPILAIDVARARDTVEALPWVKSAKIERRLPDAVHVILQERVPYALWQQGTRYTLVDRDGKAIVDIPEADQALPLIVGPDAPRHAAELFAALSSHAELAERVRAAVRVGGRRWNLYLDTYENGIAVRLPEDDVPGALARLATLERDHKILERDLDFIDLRLDDRLVVRVHREPGAEPVKPVTTKKASQRDV